MTENRVTDGSSLWKGWKRITRILSSNGKEGGTEMVQNRKQILDMLAEGKISADEAERLLTATDDTVGGGTGTSGVTSTRKPKYLRVTVTPPESEGGTGTPVVNVRVPLNLMRAGIKLKALLPPEASSKIDEAMRSKGINLDIRSIKEEDIEGLIDALSDLEVEVNDEQGAKIVRVYVE